MRLPRSRVYRDRIASGGPCSTPSRSHLVGRPHIRNHNRLRRRVPCPFPSSVVSLRRVGRRMAREVGRGRQVHAAIEQHAETGPAQFVQREFSKTRLLLPLHADSRDCRRCDCPQLDPSRWQSQRDARSDARLRLFHWERRRGETTSGERIGDPSPASAGSDPCPAPSSPSIALPRRNGIGLAPRVEPARCSRDGRARDRVLAQAQRRGGLGAEGTRSRGTRGIGPIACVAAHLRAVASGRRGISARISSTSWSTRGIGANGRPAVLRARVNHK